jgi:hypothetical protein
MRPLSALLLAAIVLGSVAIFFRLQGETNAPAAAPNLQSAAGQFDIEITLTFDAGPDDFALSASDAPSITVEFRGNELLRRTDTVAAGSALLIEDVAGITVGENSIYVRCSPKDLDQVVSRAIRVRVFCDGVEVAEQTLWSTPGSPVEGLVRLLIEALPDGRQNADGPADRDVSATFGPSMDEGVA